MTEVEPATYTVARVSRSAREIPRHDEDLLLWEPWIRSIGLRRGVSSTEIDDFVAQVYLEWIEGGYLAKYDPAKGAFTTYLWAFVSKRAMRDRDRGIRIDRKTCWEPITEEYEDVEEEGAVVLPADPHDQYLASEQDAELLTILEPLRSVKPYEVVFHVEDYVDPISGETMRMKVRVERSLYTLANFLLLGLSQRDIARVYGRSLGTVAAMVKDLRRHPAIVQAVLGVSGSFRLLLTR